MSEVTALVAMSVGWAVVVALGAVLALYALRSYRKTHTRPMLFLGAGFAVLSAGTAVAWFGIYFTFYTPEAVSIGCTATLAAGFAIILYALRTRFV